MAERSSLLKLWDLTEADLIETEIVTSDLTSSFSKQDSAEKVTVDSQSLEKFCDNCFAANSEDANWCIECGTAIIKTPSSSYVKDGYSSCIKENDQDYLQDSSKTNFDLDKLLCEKTEPLLQGAYTKYNCKISSNLTFGEIVTDRSVQQKSTSVELMGPPVVKQCRWFSTRDDECRNQHFTYNLLHVQHSNLLQLPHEILLNILSYLVHSDLYKCMLVSKHLNLLSKDPSLWKVITLQKIRNIDAAILKEIALRSPRHLSVIDCHGNIPTPDIVNFFSNGGQHIESLNIELTELGPHSTDVFLQSAAKYCSNLRSIAVNWISVSQKVIRLCSSLKELHIKNKPLSVGALQTLLCCHKYQLIKLDIESTKIDDVLMAFNNNVMPLVEHFSATFSELSNGKVIQQMMEIFPTMKALCACGISQCDDAVKELSTYPLHTLYLKQFGRSTSCYFLIREMSTLKHISIDSIDDEGLLVLCQGRLQLYSLDLSGSYITNKCFWTIFEGSFSSCLQSLKLNQCDGINDATIERTVQSFSNLYQLETVAQEIIQFVRNCQCLRLVELRGIHCLKELDSVTCKIDCVIVL